MFNEPLSGSKMADIEEFQRKVITEIIENKLYSHLKELLILYWISTENNLQSTFPENHEDWHKIMMSQMQKLTKISIKKELE